MNQYLVLPSVGTVIAIVIVVSVRFFFKDGLASRLFSIFVPLLLFAGIAMYVIGVSREPWAYYTILPFATVVCVTALYFVYRLMITRLESYTAAILASSSQLSATAKQTASTSAQQSATVSEVTATIAELTETSVATAAFAKEVMKTSADVLSKGQEGFQALDEARAVLELIGQVAEIVDAIREFAGQSNLLAVNARVEAAKAGEQGRGFAVVAAEIRNLAEQSRDSAQRIGKAVGRAESGRRALDEASRRMKELLTALSASVDTARQIAATVGQQSSGIQQISEAMVNVADGGKASAAATEQVEQAIAALRKVASELQKYISGNDRRN